MTHSYLSKKLACKMVKKMEGAAQSKKSCKKWAIGIV
jgi:hypothetical protein